MTSSGETQSPLKKSIFISDLKPRDAVRTSFLVKQKNLQMNKVGKPYLALTLADRTGEIDTRVWDAVEELDQHFVEGDIIAIGGKTHLYQDRLQLVIDDLVKISSDQIAIDDYLPKTNQDLEALYTEMVGYFEAFTNPHLKALALALLQDPEISSRYKLCPAAKTIHHAYIGGLLFHSLHLMKVADAIAPLYPAVDRELLLFGCAFHDFGKIFELSYHQKFGYTDEGRLVGHITIGAILIDRKIQKIEGFPQPLEWHVKHLILSHHGKLEFGSPKKPHTLEAELLNLLDTMDSRMESIETLLKSTPSTARWSAYHKAYDQYYWQSSPPTDSTLLS